MPTSMWCSRCQCAWYCSAEHLQSVSLFCRVHAGSQLSTLRVLPSGLASSPQGMHGGPPSSLSPRRHSDPAASGSRSDDRIGHLLPAFARRVAHIWRSTPKTYLPSPLSSRSSTGHQRELPNVPETSRRHMPYTAHQRVLPRWPSSVYRPDARSERRAPAIPSSHFLLPRRTSKKHACQPGYLPDNFGRSPPCLARTCLGAQVQRFKTTELLRRKHERPSGAVSVLPGVQVRDWASRPLGPLVLILRENYGWSRVLFRYVP